ncbi:VOC family protein [Hamadaea sp. NPDC051192]|uniref:VOC family protein n=1 Tax=Hamadaea sp. NPDC051192 TaxID=3154940 RepID=UPI0034191689
MATKVIFRTVNLDCSDAHAMARFYGGLLGWEPTDVEPDWVLMRDPGGATGLSFQQTPDFVPPVWPEELGRQQKMIHLDLKVEPGEGQDEQAALADAVALALSLGGTLPEPQGRDDLRVVLDPSGHPLCLFLV